MSDKPILCVDFDGVIHSYTSGWKGPLEISDDATPGFFEWLDKASEHFRIVVYSSRSKEPGACDAMALWMAAQRKKWRDAGGKSHITDGTAVSVEFAHEKPAAFLTLDDRAICFDGTWPDPAKMREFKPWNKRPASPPQPDALEVSELTYLMRSDDPLWGGHLERGDGPDASLHRWLTLGLIEECAGERWEARRRVPCRGYRITEAGRRALDAAGE